MLEREGYEDPYLLDKCPRKTKATSIIFMDGYGMHARRFSKYDNKRINRLRSSTVRYNEALDIAEIFQYILEYVAANDPKDAINFCRAIETLGSWDNLELHFLEKYKKTKFTSRIGILAARKKIMGMKNCVTCLNLMRSHNIMAYNTIDPGVARCWPCFSKRFKLIDLRRVRVKFENAEIPLDHHFPYAQVVSFNITGSAKENDCLCDWCASVLNSRKSQLRVVKWRASWYCLRSDVKKILSKHKKLSD